MFLTTEPSLAGKNYDALRVISTTVDQVNFKNWVKREKRYEIREPDKVIEIALEELSTKAMNLGADAVICVHVSTAYDDSGSRGFVATVMGTAIKFS